MGRKIKKSQKNKNFTKLFNISKISIIFDNFNDYHLFFSVCAKIISQLHEK